MKAVGIIVEYNPFHNGHLYQAKMARELTQADVVIAVMSASFLQRGEPSIVPKWLRTEMALKSGIDIVLELPYLYSVQKAELFAKGAIAVLASIGVHSINFGSEIGEVAPFFQLVETMDTHRDQFDQLVKQQMNKGFSYPKSASMAFSLLQLDPSILSLEEPNNILGYHYVKAIHEGRHPIQVTTTHRRQAGFHDEQLPSSSIASATSIRKALEQNRDVEEIHHVMPAVTVRLLKEYLSANSLLHTWEGYFPLLHYKVLTTAPHDLNQIYECEEGLEYRAIQMMKTAASFNDWMKKMKTKRYTWTRLQRFATHLLTNTTKEEVEEGLFDPTLPYIRLLGMSKQGQLFLNRTRKDRTIPLLTRLGGAKGLIANMDERTTSVYHSLFPPSIYTTKMKSEYKQAPIRVME